MNQKGEPVISFVSVAFVERRNNSADAQEQRRKQRGGCGMLATEAASDRPADAVASKSEERRAIGVACGAHALHDGYTDLIYVMLPIWQAEFGIGYAALGSAAHLLLRHHGGLADSVGACCRSDSACRSCWRSAPRCRGIGYLIAGASVGFWTLVIALLIGGVGSSTQHPLGSALVARAFAGSRSLKALGTYNFAGDIGKMSVPAAASLMLVLLPWQPTLAIIGALGIASAVS